MLDLVTFALANPIDPDADPARAHFLVDCAATFPDDDAHTVRHRRRLSTVCEVVRRDVDGMTWMQVQAVADPCAKRRRYTVRGKGVLGVDIVDAVYRWAQGEARQEYDDPTPDEAMHLAALELYARLAEIPHTVVEEPTP
jgi:hypothetical protein